MKKIIFFAVMALSSTAQSEQEWEQESLMCQFGTDPHQDLSTWFLDSQTYLSPFGTQLNVKYSIIGEGEYKIRSFQEVYCPNEKEGCITDRMRHVRVSTSEKLPGFPFAQIVGQTSKGIVYYISLKTLSEAGACAFGNAMIYRKNTDGGNDFFKSIPIGCSNEYGGEFCWPN